jgi:hypothetical protein
VVFIIIFYKGSSIEITLQEKSWKNKHLSTTQGNALHTKRIATVWGSELTWFNLADRLVEKAAEVARYPLKPWVLETKLSVKSGRSRAGCSRNFLEKEEPVQIANVSK